LKSKSAIGISLSPRWRDLLEKAAVLLFILFVLACVIVSWQVSPWPVILMLLLLLYILLRERVVCWWSIRRRGYGVMWLANCHAGYVERVGGVNRRFDVPLEALEPGTWGYYPLPPAAWEAAAPDWLKGRRSEFVARVQARYPAWNLE
jgi:hypothetical protein